MKKILLLIKTSTKTTFSSSMMNFTSKRKYLFIGLYLFLALYFFGISFISSYFTIETLASSPDTMPAVSFVPVIMMSMASLLVFVTSLFSASNSLFKAKDLNMQFAMPLTHFSILATKFTGLYFLNLLFSAIILIPNCIVYFMFVPFDFIVFIIFVLSIVISPLIPCILGTILSALMTFAFGKFRRKNLIELALVLIFVYFYISFIGNAQSSIEYIISNANNLFESLTSIYFPAFLFHKAINGNIPHFLLYLAASIVPTFLLLRLIAPLYSKLVAKANQSSVKTNYRLTTQKQSNKRTAMLKKELTMFFSSTVYVLNTVFMLVLLTGASVYAILSKDQILPALSQISVELDLTNLLFLFALVALTSATAMSATTGPSISLEGNRIWIYKAAPISTMDIFKAKISVSMYSCLPLVFVNAVIYSIAFRFDAIQFLLLLIVPSVALFATSELGLIFNLLFPKMIWKNETMVVKNSASVMFSVFSSMALSMVYVVLGIVLIDVINPYILSVVFLLISALLAYIFYNILNNYGKQKFESILIDN